jgi:hypothetical protein
MTTKAKAAKQEPTKEPDPDQSARFKETARKLGCDTTPGALDRAFGKIEPTRRREPTEGSTR